MKMLMCVLFLFVVLAFAGAQNAKAQNRCKVTDPTGTPLNVRASANGKILQKIKNGKIVYIEQTTYDSKNRPWVQISQSTKKGRKILGWVFQEFISCSSKNYTNENESWETFFSKFKTAVRNRDSATLKSVMQDNNGYMSFYFQPLRNQYSKEFVVKQLSLYDNKGWKALEKILFKGKLEWDTDDAKNFELTYKQIGLPDYLQCDNYTGGMYAAHFTLINGHWIFTGFHENAC